MANSAMTQAALSGVGPGVGNGMWTLVERKEFASAATSHTFSGLNGDADRRYFITGVLNNTTGGGVYYAASCRTDTTAANYTYQADGGVNTPWAGRDTNAGFFLGYVPASNSGVAELVLHAKTGTPRWGVTHYARSNSGAVEAYVDHGAFWSNTTDNIDQIVVPADTSSGIGAGSYVELWKLGPPPPIATGEWALVERFTATSITSTHSFAGLDGDAAKCYMIRGLMVRSSAEADILLRFNGDTGSNYYGRNNENGATATANTTGCRIGYLGSGNEPNEFEAVVWTQSGRQRSLRCHYNRIVSSQYPTEGTWTTCWNSTANITDITVYCPTSNGFAVGTVMELWKLAQ